MLVILLNPLVLILKRAKTYLHKIVLKEGRGLEFKFYFCHVNNEKKKKFNSYIYIYPDYFYRVNSVCFYILKVFLKKFKILLFASN
jgi:hypothetical protein